MGIILSALGGGAGAVLQDLNEKDKLARESALLNQRSNVELQRQVALESFKQNAKTARQQAALTGGATGSSSPAAMAVGAGTTTVGGAVGGVQASPNVSPTFGTGNVSAQDLPGLAQKYGVPEAALRNDLAYNDGKGIADMVFKASRPDFDTSGGVAIDKRNLRDGQVLNRISTTSSGQTTMVGSDGAGGAQVTVPRGAPEAYGMYKGIDAGIAASSKPIKVINPDTGAEEFASEAQVLKAANGAGPGSGSTPSGNHIVSAADQASRDADGLFIKQGELKKAQQQLSDAQAVGDAAKVQRYSGDVAGIQREISRSTATASLANDQGGASQAPAQPAGRMAASLSTNAKAGADALGDLNKSWLKNSYEPAVEGGKAAADMVTNVKVARQGLNNMGGTGWGAEGRIKAQAVLEGLGMGTQDSKRALLGMQQFQNAAMGRLQVTLNAAKGPQTEGDADRASQTFATLRNTTQANNFILDMAQAKAERDQLQAKFYLQSLPSARSSGDLTSVDRIWSNKMPSVFDMPSMQRWAVK